MNNNGYESADEAEDMISNQASIQQHPAIIKPRKKLYRKKTHKTHNMQLARHDPINKLCKSVNQLSIKRISPHRVKLFIAQ